jgi:hypothetical protein
VRYVAETRRAAAQTAVCGGSKARRQDNAMPQGAKILRGGIEVVSGTPLEPVLKPALFLKVWRRKMPNGEKRLYASLSMVRRSRQEYVVKELLAETEMEPDAAVDKAVAIARRGDVSTVYLNADLTKLPPLPAAG